MVNNNNSALKVTQFLTTNVQFLPSVGPKIAEKLKKLEIITIGDLLLHAPIKYQDRCRVTAISDLVHGSNVQIQVSIKNITKSSGNYKHKKQRLIVQAADKTGAIDLVFFKFYSALLDKLKPNEVVRCYGQVKYYQAKWQMVHPELDFIQANKNNLLKDHYAAIYPTTQGINQKYLAKIIDIALTKYLEISQVQGSGITDLFFEQYKSVFNNKLLTFCDALKIIHKPKIDINIDLLQNRNHPAFIRLIAEELWIYRKTMHQKKLAQTTKKAKQLNVTQVKLSKFINNFGFKLTKSQNKVIQEIAQDLSKPKPMLRLLQGDVGSGKTVVAAVASFIAAVNQQQIAIMAPTEILAEQLAKNFSKWFDAFDLKVAYLTGKLSAKSAKLIREQIFKGEVNIIVGTHALFQDKTEYKSLGLIIIDEQHRFGVEQRKSLSSKSKGFYPHQLIMTATPIPRTLAMSSYAFLDISSIDSLPPNRQEITTALISNARRDELISKIESICSNNQQVYWVCPFIEESDVIDASAAIKIFEYLNSKNLNLKLGLIHGQMDVAAKEEVMQQFKNGTIDLLVATTVIEVGVDVPNATLIIIENSERMGLAQLHQLRGRVGRGSKQSFCIFLYQEPLSFYAQKRLAFIRDNTDGFKLAEADLKLRGMGEILGTKQTGIAKFKIADLTRDVKILKAIVDEDNKENTENLANIEYGSSKTNQLLQFSKALWLHDKLKYSVA